MLEENLSDSPGAPVDRRTFMVATATSTGVAGLGAGCATTDAASGNGVPASRTVSTTINGKPVRVSVEARASLLDTLRERLALTGAKKGCDHGQCGACTVHVDGKRVASCLTLAVKADGKSLTTIEGLESADGTLHPMQQAFVDHDALQCGYCTPGQIMAAVACVREGHATTDEQIREYMSGNICRCGAYAGILEAIRDGAERMRGMARA